MMKPLSKAIRLCQGQALVMMLLVLLATWMGFIWVVQLSERSQRMTHIQQVADHATEAFAVIAARDLNYQAVTNRAMIANSVAIAQLVGLQSYFNMMVRTSQHASLIVSWVPYLNAIMARIAQTLQSLNVSFSRSVTALIGMEKLLIQLLSHSQLLFHAAAAATALTTAKGIVETGDDNLELVLLNHATLPEFSYLWLMYQHRRSDSAAFTNMVQRSRDGFSTRRSYTWFRVNAGVRARFEKWGGTEVVPTAGQRMNWQAIDVATLRVRLGPFRAYTVPVGWGGAAAGNRPPVHGRVTREAFGGAYQARRSLSQQSAMQATIVHSFAQAPLYSSVDANNKLPQITLVVREIEGSAKAFAISRAQLQFSRPNILWPRRDSLIERANLFNGLWRAQLVSIPFAEQWLLEQQL